MGNEPAWSGTVHSDTRMNKMTIIPNTGAVLAGLDKTKHGLLICTSAGSGLIKDHIYLCNADGDSLIDISEQTAHTHVDESRGGSLERILSANPGTIDLWLTKTQDLKNAQWNTANASGGTIEDKIDGTTGERSLRLRTNTTSGGSYTISYPHLSLNFAKTATLTSKVQVETASSLALHCGVGADDVTAADSNTRKFNVEVCTAVNNNWHLRTANGSGNSSSDTGVAMTTSRVSFWIDHNPTLGTPETNVWFGNPSNVFQKTSHVPTSGTTAQNNLVKFSIKNSTGADRPLLCYGARLSYITGDTWIV